MNKHTSVAVGLSARVPGIYGLGRAGVAVRYFISFVDAYPHDSYFMAGTLQESAMGQMT